jgi:hypothetical protein
LPQELIDPEIEKDPAKNAGVGINCQMLRDLRLIYSDTLDGLLRKRW